MEPKQVIIEDEYPLKDLKAAEEVLSRRLAGKGKTFKSGDELIQYLRKRIKKEMKIPRPRPDGAPVPKHGSGAGPPLLKKGNKK